MKPKIPKSKKRTNSPAPAVAGDENNFSSPIREDTCRYIGVTYRSRRKKYQARMYRGSHEYNLGLFDLAADAALAYDAAHRVAGGRGMSSSAATSKATKDGDGSSRGSSPMIADAAEIKYALDWIDCVGELERPPGLSDDDPMHLNFLHPSDFRQAREREISALKEKNNSGNNSEEDVAFPTESELKMRMKQEILNIAKAYVSQQTKSPGPPDEGSDLTTSNDDEEEEEEDELTQTGGEIAADVRNMGSGPAKKRKLQHMSVSAAYDECREDAQTLLSLNKRSSKESKQAARAQKLMEFMTGGDSAVNSKDTGSNDKKQSAADAENIQQQLQQNLARQQALTIDSFHGTFNQNALMNSLLSQYSLEQVLRFASERPDLVNEETIREFVGAQKTGMSEQLVQDNQTELLYAQLQAAMMTGGHFNPTQLPTDLQTLAMESMQSRQNRAGGGSAQGGTVDGKDTRQDGKSTFRSPREGESGPSHESPFLMKVLEEYKKQGAGNQDQAALQKKITNEAKRAALAQKLSVHLSNEPKATPATGITKTDEKGDTGQTPSVADSKDEAAKFAKVASGDTENKDRRASSNSKEEHPGGNDFSGVGNSSDVGASASSERKAMSLQNAIPPRSSAPFAGLQQGIPSLHTMDPFQQAILQHTMANGDAQQLQQISQSFGGRNAAELPTPEAAYRLQQRLVNEEYRLQQLRQALQTQALSQYLNAGGIGVPGSNIALNRITGNAFTSGLGNSLMQQSMNNNNNQELLLRQALALQSNQNSSMSGLQQPVNNEHLLLAAQSQGIDPGTLAQLLMRRGGAPPSSASKKD